MDLFLQNATYNGTTVDMLVKDGRVAAFGPSLPTPADTVPRLDARHSLLFPSLIDAHVHLREPGFEWKENIQSGLTAAARGGFGHVIAMANTDPVNDSAGITRSIIESAHTSHPHGPFVHPVAAATVGLEGKELAPLGELAAAGCLAVSNDGLPLANTEILRRVMEYASDLGLILTDHCEDPYLAKKSQMNEGQMSASLGLKGQPDIAEAIQVARDVLLAEYLRIPVHLAHISAKISLDIIAWAKSRGVPVTAETCPHYLFLTDEALSSYNSNAKVNPPLRTAEDVAAMREAVKSGLIDILATDHAPHAAHEKEHPLDLAPNGISGLDTALSLYVALMQENVLTHADIIRLCATKPAEIFRIPVNTFQPGDIADFVLFDPAHEWVVSRESMFSKSANTPWLGQTMKGRVSAHYMAGKPLW